MLLSIFLLNDLNQYQSITDGDKKFVIIILLLRSTKVMKVVELHNKDINGVPVTS